MFFFMMFAVWSITSITWESIDGTIPFDSHLCLINGIYWSFKNVKPRIRPRRYRPEKESSELWNISNKDKTNCVHSKRCNNLKKLCDIEEHWLIDTLLHQESPFHFHSLHVKGNMCCLATTNRMFSNKRAHSEWRSILFGRRRPSLIGIYNTATI